MWTEEQQQAIQLEGKNIIVSAGAGSGKTAVLSERVLRKVKEGCHINELLILTFTKAAAAEMKERIRKKLIDASMLEEASLIESSYITTFDAFSLAIVKKYHTKLNITKDVSITDEVLIDFEKKRILEEIMDKNYLSPKSTFLKLINDFCLKDDDKLKEYILNIYNKLDLMYDKDEYLKKYLVNNYSEEKINSYLLEYVNLLKEKINDIKDIIKRMSLYLDGSYIEELEKDFTKLYEARTYNDIRLGIVDKIKQLPRNSSLEVKKLKESLTDINNELKELTLYKDEEEIKEELLSTKSDATALVNILLEFSNSLDKFKRENNFYTFNDISKMAISVVLDNKEVREELTNSFKEILVDEYQDTSDIEEKFISLISNDNLYMVGDIKQSIYRFRNANPYIFKNKYDTFRDTDLGIKIDLLKNFRSRKEVLDNINAIFDLVMDDGYGGADYKKAHKMIFGNKTYEEKKKDKQDYNIELYTYDKDIKTTRRDELEAFIIADDIKRKVEEHYQIFDKEKKELREVTYADFAILIDKGKSFDLYKKIFEYKKIPLNILREEKVGRDADILVIKNLLRFLICLKNNNFDLAFKYSFISLARSFLFRMPDDLIYETFINDTYKETAIYQKCLPLALKMDEFSPAEYLYYILEELRYDEAIIAIGNMASTRVREEYIYNLIKNYEAMGKTIYEFTDYLDELFSNDYTLKFEKKETLADAVLIMTIHKSKGLEYPICYFAGFSNKFNLSELKERIVFDNKYGLVLPKVDGYYKDTIVKTLLKYTTRKEEISEKIRLLYVALSRAKEKMIIVTKEIEENDSDYVSSYQKMKYDNFYAILKSIYKIVEGYFKKSEVVVNKDYKENNKVLEINPKKEENLVVEKCLITTDVIENKHFSKEAHLITKEEKETMLFGENVHRILEEIDFLHPDFSRFDNTSIINCIKNFLNSPLIKENINNKMYKEYEFVYEDKELYHGIIDLLIEKEKEMIIIDYKLKNILDDAYNKQLNGYRTFIEKKTKKETRCYLYSIMENKFLEVEKELPVNV